MNTLQNLFRKNQLIIAISLSAIFSLPLAGPAFAQQIPVYNLYMFNPASYNPAMAGINEMTNAFLMSRLTLSSMPGAPVTHTVSVDGSLKENAAGWGLNLSSDKTGIASLMAVSGTYAYRVNIAEEHKLFLGLSLSYLQYNIDKAAVIVKDPNEPLLMNQNYKTGTVDGNFGATYRWKNLEVAGGVNRLMANSIKLQNQSDVSYNMDRHYFASLQYRLFIDAKKDMSITPIVFFRTASSGKMPQEATFLFNWKQKLDIGFSYKSDFGYSLIVGTKIYDALRIAYSYDIVTSKISPYAGMSNEIMIGYSFGILSREMKKQQKQVDDLLNNLEDFKEAQNMVDEIQSEFVKKQGQKIDTLSAGYKENKQKIAEANAKVDQTQKNLDALTKQLKDAGLIKEASVTEYEGNVQKGYYLVIGSIKDENYNAAAMQKEFIDKGFEQVYNKKTKWHYAYMERYNDLPTALENLKKARKGKYKDAWVHILK